MGFLCENHAVFKKPKKHKTSLATSSKLLEDSPNETDDLVSHVLLINAQKRLRICKYIRLKAGTILTGLSMTRSSLYSQTSFCMLTHEKKK